jgi:hypothetical protein
LIQLKTRSGGGDGSGGAACPCGADDNTMNAARRAAATRNIGHFLTQTH